MPEDQDVADRSRRSRHSARGHSRGRCRCSPRWPVAPWCSASSSTCAALEPLGVGHPGRQRYPRRRRQPEHTLLRKIERPDPLVARPLVGRGVLGAVVHRGESELIEPVGDVAGRRDVPGGLARPDAIPRTPVSSSDMDPARAVTSPSLTTSSGTPNSSRRRRKSCGLRRNAARDAAEQRGHHRPVVDDHAGRTPSDGVEPGHLPRRVPPPRRCAGSGRSGPSGRSAPTHLIAEDRLAVDHGRHLHVRCAESNPTRPPSR